MSTEPKSDNSPENLLNSRLNSSVESDFAPPSPHKKHKKHKHKKHKRKRDSEEGVGSSEFLDTNDPGKPSLKLKIKIGGQMLGEKSVSRLEIAEDSSDDSPNPGDDEEEEEAWLDALESGRLDEVDDELRKMKDPALMTARQRALFESKTKDRDDHAALPPEPPEKEMTEEMIQRKILRAKKRKELAEEKREKDKKQTLERLLKKPESSRTSKLVKRQLIKKVSVPKMTYVNNVKGTTISFPIGYSFPMKAQQPALPPPIVNCGVKGCTNPKRYKCSVTSIPLCSLACYKILHRSLPSIL